METCVRTINEAHKEIVKLDPETRIKAFTIRSLILENKIPHTKVGKTYLVDVYTVLEYFKGKREEMPSIRPVMLK
jgi:hypothetical protein